MSAERKEQSVVDQLLTMSPYGPDTEEKESLFCSALGEAIRKHAEGNVLYAAFLRRKGFDFHAPLTPEKLVDVPFLPVQVFKALGAQLRVVPEDQIRMALSSSATSGQPSTVLVDQITARRQARCMGKVLSDVIGTSRRPFLILDTDPAALRLTQNARSVAVRAYLTFASRATYLMEENSAGLSLREDLFSKTVAELNPDIPVVLFGFTYILYDSLIRLALNQGLHFPLPQGSILLHIGGWKKLEAEKISRDLFIEHASNIFDVHPTHVVDVYGFTEQMGLNYPDCPCGWKHTPVASRVIVRHPVNHEPLPPGENGVLEFLTPLPHSYPGAAVLTDDIGVINPAPCPFHRGGTRFQVLGRMQKAEARGCGDILGEKLRTRRVTLSPQSASGQLETRTWGATKQLSDIPHLVSHVRKAQEWFAAQPVEAIIGLIDDTAQTWLENPAFEAWKHHGLFYLVQWCAADNLRALAFQALRGLPQCLDTFTHEPERKRHLLRALPQGLVVHWLSGNVPLLGMLVLVQSLVTKNLNILKTASNNLKILADLLSTFSGRVHTTSTGHTIRGDDLLRTLALVHYPHTNLEPAKKLSMAADVRIAWGGREAVDAVCALPAKAECEDVIFGPKTSFMVVSHKFLRDEKSINKILRRAATDISSFDQTACSSPHTLFVEKGGTISPESFAERLGDFLEKALQLIPKAPEDDATAAAVQTARAVGNFLGQCWHGKGINWTVLYDERLELARPVYSRTITVRPVNDIHEIIPLIHDGIQTIGLAVEETRRISFAEAAAARGAFRFPEVGVMTAFDAPWDGMFVMDRLVRWVTLGGTGLPFTRKAGRNVSPIITREEIQA